MDKKVGEATNQSLSREVFKSVEASMTDYTTWVESAWPRLFRTAYALTGNADTAEELLQEALVKLYVAWRRVARANAPEAYARRVLVNLASSRWRARSRRGEMLTADPAADIRVSGFERRVTESSTMWSLITELPPRQRAVLVLRYYEDLSEREIATILEMAPGTVKSLSNAAIAKLRSAYIREEKEALR